MLSKGELQTATSGVSGACENMASATTPRSGIERACYLRQWTNRRVGELHGLNTTVGPGGAAGVAWWSKRFVPKDFRSYAGRKGSMMK